MTAHGTSCWNCGGAKPKGQGRKLCDPCRAELRGHIANHRCRRCGAERAYGKQLCDDCRELAQWKKRRQRHPRKPCMTCGKLKGPGRGRRECPTCHAARLKPSVCIVCMRRPRRYRTAKLCQFCFDTQGERIRKYRAAHAKQYRLTHPDPPRKKPSSTEHKRIHYRLRAEQEGRTVAPVPEKAYVERYGAGYSDRIDAEPLLAFLASCEDPFAVLGAPGYDSVKRIRKEGDVSVTVADRLITALDGRLAYVYPELFT